MQLMIPTLGRGKHDAWSDKRCFMEMEAWIAGEAHSDAPTCTSYVVAAFMRSWNDGLEDGERTSVLAPLVGATIGTGSRYEHEQPRLCMIASWMMSAQAARWARFNGLLEAAISLAGFRHPPCHQTRDGHLKWMTKLLDRLSGRRRSLSLRQSRYSSWPTPGKEALGRSAGLNMPTYSMMDLVKDAVLTGRDLEPTIRALQTSARQLVLDMCALGREARPPVTARLTPLGLSVTVAEEAPAVAER
jgi:hypothetical protein